MKRIDLETWTAKEVARLLTLVDNDRRYYQEILATLPFAVAVVTADLNLVLVNRGFRLMFGLKQEELADKRLDDMLVSDLVKERIPRLIDLNTPETAIAINVAAPDGATRQCRLSVIPLGGGYSEGPREALIAIVESEQASCAAAVILDELGALLWNADVQTGGLNFANSAMTRLIGKSQPSNWTKRVHPDDASRVNWVYEAAVESGKEATVEYRALRDGGVTTWFADRIRPVMEQGKVTTLQIITTEVSARRDRIERLVQNREMDAMMRLAQHVAHEFNNLWMIVNGYTEVVAEQLGSSDPDLSSSLDAIQQAAGRGMAGTSQLLQFGRPPSARLQTIDLHALVATSPLSAELRLMKGSAPVSVDPLQLQNALQAILEFVQSRLEDSCQPAIETELTAQISDLADEMPRGKFVTMRIGPVAKIKPRLVAHWCDPYFSEAGKAAPIGMALVYSQLREMGVWMRLEALDSETGQFILEFPLARLPEPKRELANVAQAASAARSAVPALETVLVVDDEESIRSLVSRVLSQQGYEVIEAATGEEAIRFCDSRSGSIPLVVSDVILPGMRGPEMIKQLRRSRAGLKVLYLSGYTDDPDLAAGLLDAGEGFLQKPFSLQSLSQTVRAVLDAEPD